MTCNEFRTEFEKTLDNRVVHTPTPAQQEHLHTCTACRGYTQSMNSLYEQLRNIPRMEIPESLLSKIQSIPECEKFLNNRLTWKKDILRAVMYILPGFLVYIVGITASPTISDIAMNLLLLISLIVVAMNIMKRPILGFNGI